MTKPTWWPFRFGYDVDQSVRDALAADPDFVHPEYVEHPAWIIRDGHPVAARVVGVIRPWQPASYSLSAFAIEYAGVVTVMRSVYWSAHAAASAQAELDEAMDL